MLSISDKIETAVQCFRVWDGMLNVDATRRNTTNQDISNLFMNLRVIHKKSYLFPNCYGLLVVLFRVTWVRVGPMSISNSYLFVIATCRILYTGINTTEKCRSDWEFLFHELKGIRQNATTFEGLYQCRCWRSILKLRSSSYWNASGENEVH